MSGDVQFGQSLLQNILARFHGNLVNWDGLAAPFRRGAARQVKIDRFEDLTAPEGDARSAAAEQHLVDVVMEHHAESVHIVTREPHGDSLGNGVTKSVRVPEALALDDFDGPGSWRESR